MASSLSALNYKVAALFCIVCFYVYYLAFPTRNWFLLLANEATIANNETKRVLLWTTRYQGASKWLEGNISCSSNKFTCEFTTDRSLIEGSHALVFYGWYADMYVEEYFENGTRRYKPGDIPEASDVDQYWTFFNLEPPAYQAEHLEAFDNLFNWTMSYRKDSDIYIPFGTFVKREGAINETFDLDLLLRTKTKLAVQVASMCKNPSQREELIKALQKYIPVDVYGKCGRHKCPSAEANFDCKEKIGKEYKFYLAFENSLCQDYVTEKFFEAYAAGMVPVVYGGVNYDLIAPSGSYINVNSFRSVKALAKYLNYLDGNDEQYLKYFEWKKTYNVTFLGMNDYKHMYCLLCEKLHEDYPKRSKSTYPSIANWLNIIQGMSPACNKPLFW